METSTVTHLDDRMLLDDLDATPQNDDTILHDTVSLPQRILLAAE